MKAHASEMLGRPRLHWGATVPSAFIHRYFSQMHREGSVMYEPAPVSVCGVCVHARGPSIQALFLSNTAHIHIYISLKVKTFA